MYSAVFTVCVTVKHSFYMDKNNCVIFWHSSKYYLFFNFTLYVTCFCEPILKILILNEWCTFRMVLNQLYYKKLFIYIISNKVHQNNCCQLHYFSSPKVRIQCQNSAHHQCWAGQEEWFLYWERWRTLLLVCLCPPTAYLSTWGNTHGRQISSFHPLINQ